MPIQPALTALNLPNTFRRQANSSADQLPEHVSEAAPQRRAQNAIVSSHRRHPSVIGQRLRTGDGASLRLTQRPTLAWRVRTSVSGRSGRRRCGPLSALRRPPTPDPSRR